MTAFKSLINLIEDNEDLIDFDHNGIEDLNVISGKLFNDIITAVDNIEDKNIDKKEFIKKALKTFFNLTDQDLIVIKQEQIVVKVIQNMQRDETEKRFNGYSEDEIEKLYNKYFTKDSLNNFIKDISFSAFKYLFIRKQVTNDYYEKNVYSIIQNQIANELTDFKDENDEFRIGFAGYIFRINFLEVFSHISDHILEAISYRDDYLMAWIKYYNGQIIIKQNQRYEAPSIVNKDGLKYNPSALFGTIAMWFKTKEKIQILRKRLTEIHKELDKLKINGISAIKYKEALIDERQEIEKDLSDANERIKVLLDEKRLNKDEEKKYDINDEIQELRLDVKEDRKELEAVNSEIMTIDTISTKRLEEDRTRIEKDIIREEKALKQNQKVYQSIQSALVKALTSKKKPL